VIRDLADVSVTGGLDLLYGAIAAGVTWGAVLGVVGIWLSVAARGGDQ